MQSWPFLFWVQTYFVLLYFALLQFADTMFFFTNWWFDLVSSKSTSAIFPTAFDLFVLLCSILVILTVLQNFFFIIVRFVTVISYLLQLQKDFVSLKAEIMVRSFFSNEEF